MSILVIAEQEANRLKPATAQVVAAAAVWQKPIDLLVFGDQPNGLAREAAQLMGVKRVLVAQAEHFLHPLVEDVQDLILGIASKYEIIVAAHSVLGKSVLPAVAAHLDVAPITDVTAIQLDPGAAPVYVRPEYAGNIFTYIENTQPRQIISVRPTAFRAVGSGGNAEILSVSAPSSRGVSQWLADDINESERPDLSSARIVVAGGRSLGEDFGKLLTPIAEDLDAAIGATRACVDAGFAPNDWQVGQTGTVIAPELYIAVGISGAMQHIAGIKDSKAIVAINHDPDAPIFKYADYGLVADLFTALPELHTALQHNRQ